MLAERESPFAYLGYMYLFECLTPILTERAKGFLAAKGFPMEARVFIDVHAEEDLAHSDVLTTLIQRVIRDYPHEAASIEYGFDCFAVAYPLPIWNAVLGRALAEERGLKVTHQLVASGDFGDGWDNIRILAPTAKQIPASFAGVHIDSSWYRDCISEVQRFRGRIYLEDRAIPPDAVDASGRHISPHDVVSWHIIARAKDHIVGCTRLRVWDKNAPPDVTELQMHEMIGRMVGDSREHYISSLFMRLSRTRGGPNWQLPRWEVGRYARTCATACSDAYWLH